MPQELSEEVLQEVAPKTQQRKKVNEQIDAILEIDADKERESIRKTHVNSIPGAIWRVGNKIDTLNKLIAIALKQKYGYQN